MAPIANLVVRLSAQISEFQKSFADATAKIEKFGDDFAKTAAGIGQQSTGIGSSFSGIVESAAGVAAGMLTAQAAIGAVSAAFGAVEKVIDATFGSIKDAVTNTADLGDELFGLSQKTGLSVESLSAFKFVAGQTNTSLESITGAVFKLESNLGSGAKKTADALNGIGLSLKQLRSEDPAQAFSEIIAKLGELPNASARAATGVAIFGKSFKDIAQLTQEDLPGLIGQAKELGLVMSTETAVASDRLKDAFGVLHGAGQGLQQQLGAKLLPAVVAFTEVFGGIFLDAIKKAVGSTKSLGESFDLFVVQMGEAVARAIEVLARLVEATAQWAIETSKRLADQTRAFLDIAPAIITVGRALDLALSGGSHATAFDSLAATLEKLKKPLDAAAESAVTVGNKIREAAKGIAEAAKGAGATFGFTFSGIQQQISDAADEMRKKLKAVGGGGVEGAAAAKDAFSSFGNQLRDLTAQIDRAKQNGTPLAELVRLFGDEAAKATPKAAAWGIAVKTSVADVAKAFNAAALDKTLTKLDDQFDKFFSTRAQAQFKKLQAGMHESAVAIAELPKTIRKLDDGFTAFANRRFERTFTSLTSAMKSADQVAAELGNTFGKVFARVGASLPALFAQGFQQGGLTGAMVAVAGGAAQQFGDVFKAGIARVAKDAADGIDSKLTFGEKAAGWGAAAAQSFVTGFQSGLQNPSTTSALTSVASGFIAGLMVGGPIGGGVGAGIALAGFLAGAFQNAREEAKAVGREQDKLITQFHGLQGLTNAASRAGFSIPDKSGRPLSTEDSVRFLTQTNDVDSFNKAVGALNASLDDYNERLKAIASSTDGVNARTAAFAKQFAPIVAAKKTATDSGDTAGASKASQQIQELAQRAQPEFERLGLFVRDTFAAIVKETGNAIGAITQLAPSFQTLKDGIGDFGLTSTAVIDSLLSSFDIVNNEAFKPLFENIQATGQLLKGLFDAKALSADTFQVAAADIGQSIQEIVNKGGDMAKTLALSAPQLQTLWEAQQTLGGITDQTTQSILAQAEAQGVVGEKFKSVNEKILDVLLAIGKVLNADIPSGLAGLAAPAAGAGAAIRDSLGQAFDDVAAKADPTVGESLRRLGTPAGEASTRISSSLTDALTTSANTVDPTMGAALRDLNRPSKDAADAITTELTHAGDVSSARIEAAMRGCWLTAEQRAELAAKNISSALSGIKVPDITIPVDVDVTNPPPIKIDFDTSGFDLDAFRRTVLDPDKFKSANVTALASGGIVRSPTLAIVGEAGPEAVIPLSRLSPAPSRGSTSSKAPVFHVTINGDVDSDARAQRVVADFARIVRRGGQPRTVVFDALGVE